MCHSTHSDLHRGGEGGVEDDKRDVNDEEIGGGTMKYPNAASISPRDCSSP